MGDGIASSPPLMRLRWVTGNRGVKLSPASHCLLPIQGGGLSSSSSKLPMDVSIAWLYEARDESSIASIYGRMSHGCLGFLGWFWCSTVVDGGGFGDLDRSTHLGTCILVSRLYWWKGLC